MRLRLGDIEPVLEDGDHFIADRFYVDMQAGLC